jgi:glutamine synthetase
MAFTGNKFEFRMVGSSQSMSGPQTSSSTPPWLTCSRRLPIVWRRPEDKLAESHAIIRDFYRAHKRIIFNGNGYGPEWAKEAARRGLPERKDTVSALPEMVSETSIALFERQKVFTREEVVSREELYLDTFSKQVNIEASVMLEMIRKSIIPAVTKDIRQSAVSLSAQKAQGLDVTAADGAAETEERTVGTGHHPR